MTGVAIPKNWTVVRLEELGVFSSGGTPSKEIAEYRNGCIPWITAKDLKSFYLVSSIVKVSQLGSKNGTRLAPANTLLILVRGMTLLKDVPIGITTVPMAFNQDVRAFRVHDKNDPVFIAFALTHAKPRLMSLVNVAGHGTGRLATELLQDFSIKVPEASEEQRRIAAILTVWDRAIGLIGKLIDAKQNFKQGLIERLLATQSESGQECKLGELFKQRKKKGISGLPTYSVTIDNGLILRDSLDRKNDSALRPEEHLLIEKDDIAYNMMRMWQGASGLAPASGLISPAYVVIRASKDVDPLFASYWFKTPRVVKKFQDYSHGLTKDRLRLYYKDFASITLPVPPTDLQRKVAKVLSAFDRELDCLTRKLELLKRQKKGLMQQLLTGKVRVKVPEEVA